VQESSLQNWPGLRINFLDEQDGPSELQITNLFWIKDGYLYFFADSVKGEIASRMLLILQQWLPFRELENKTDWQTIMTGAEECFYVDPERKLIDSVFRRRIIHSLVRYFWQKIFGCNWSKEYPQLWPILPVRQIGRIKVGNSKLWGRKLREEL
jgi:hypothetical protein